MSRIAKQPVEIPAGVDVKLQGQHLAMKGPVGEMSMDIHRDVSVEQKDNQINVVLHKAGDSAMAGTMRALINNLVTGVSKGFERKLELVGVGYRAQARGKVLNLTLGFSHPIEYPVPEGITIETPSQTEVIVRGTDKQKVGQVAAEIRAFRKPEPYKGKGVKYSDERVVRKEAKKK
ncbi:MAG: 50S ribosomal protein L6 [Proteobacteria bacterium]|nr:50S ribosomal protein L6 [Gammaproteobacteria bacterium]MXY14725.1 50S ribosomal protein L6 [Pseudomonadota bacterium]